MFNNQAVLRDNMTELFINIQTGRFGLRREFLDFADLHDYKELGRVQEEAQQRYYAWQRKKERARLRLDAKFKVPASRRQYGSERYDPQDLWHWRKITAERIATILKEEGLPRPSRIKEPTREQKEMGVKLMARMCRSSYRRHTNDLPQWLLDIRTAWERNDSRLNSSEWVPVVWADETWFLNSPYAVLHQPHISVKNPEMIAYTQSVDKLLRDIQTPTKPGRYLQQFFSDVLTEAQIKEWAERQASYCAGGSLDFIENTDPDGWEWVYRHGPDSCMQGESVVKCYARPGNHLRLAYINLGSKDHPDIVARAIVREDKKQFVRCYPNDNSTEESRWKDRIRHLLTEAGYSHGNLDGIKIKTWEESCGEWACPYVDHGNGGCQEAEWGEDDDGYYLLLGRGRLDVATTDGYVEVEGRYLCPCCDSRVDADDTTYVEHRGEHICDDCLNSDYTLAIGRRGRHDYYPNDEVIYCRSNAEYYYEDYANENNVYECADSNEWYSLDDVVECVAGTYEDQMIHVDRAVFIEALDGYIFIDDAERDYAGAWQFADELEDASDGARVHADELEEYEEGLRKSLVSEENEDQLELPLAASNEPAEQFAIAA